MILSFLSGNCRTREDDEPVEKGFRRGPASRRDEAGPPARRVSCWDSSILEGGPAAYRRSLSVPVGILARASYRYPDAFSPIIRPTMAAARLAMPHVRSVALTVAGPPRILTAFHVPGIGRSQNCRKSLGWSRCSIHLRLFSELYWHQTIASRKYASFQSLAASLESDYTPHRRRHAGLESRRWVGSQPFEFFWSIDSKIQLARDPSNRKDHRHDQGMACQY